FNAVTADLGGLQGAFNAIRQRDHGFLGFHGLHGATDDAALLVVTDVVHERIAGQLLDAERDALALRIDRQDDRFQLVALGVLAHSGFAGLVPADVAEVNQTVDVTFQTDEDTEVGDRHDVAADAVAFLVLLGEGIPGVLLALFQAQRNATTLLVDVEDHDLYLVTQLHDLGGMDVLVGPVHLADVHQAFHALFQLGEAAVVGEVGNNGLDAGVLRVTALDVDPGVGTQLFQAQGHAVALAVELEDLDFDVLANRDDLAGVLDALPAHVGDVQQAVDATEVDE